jgi:hypothetical protein
MASYSVFAAALWSALVLGAAPARAADDEFSYSRAYSRGETRRYDVERRIFRDGVQTYTARGVTVHSVGEPPRGETIRFETLAKYANDVPFDVTSEALKFPGFTVSAGTADAEAPPFPETTGLDPSVAGLVSDLRAVYLAVSPFAGVGRLRRIGDSFTLPEPLSLARGGTDATPVSEDCLTVKLALMGLSPSKAVLRATFSPPDEACRPPRKPWMEKPVDPDGAPNDVWQVSRAGATYRVLWGVETLVVDATLDPKTGVLLAADLDDMRVVKERSGCDASLDRCSPETDAVLRRTLRIKAR